MKRGSWGTRFGFYLAAVGSAFGLGNIWRFPYIVSENGGGAFVLLYLLLVFVIGMPFIIGELLLGKLERKNIFLALRSIAQQSLMSATTDAGAASGTNSVRGSWKTRFKQRILFAFPWLGRISVWLSLLVLAYYSVISGWVLYYLVQIIVMQVFGGPLSVDSLLFRLLESLWIQIFFTFLHLCIVTVIVLKDIEEGLERFLGFMMPVFLLLLVILAIKSMSLDSAPEALRFLLYPDFSQLKPSALSQALGHVLFTLGIGFGTMVTFGSYLADRAYIPLAGFRVSVVDAFISVFAGVLIFPLAFVAAEPFQGPSLLFQSIPVLVSEISGGTVFTIGFFLCLYLASLGASMGLLETAAVNVRDIIRRPRRTSVFVSALVAVVLSIIPAMSSNVLKSVRWGNRGVLEIIDTVLINWILPLAALLISQVVLHYLNEKLKKEEFLKNESEAGLRMYTHWRFALRWIVTPLTVFALLLQLVELF